MCAGARSSKPLKYTSFGAACSEVEVDLLTGEKTVLRSDLFFDCGRSLNPAVDIGQVIRTTRSNLHLSLCVSVCLCLCACLSVSLSVCGSVSVSVPVPVSIAV